MRMDDSIKSRKKNPVVLHRGILMSAGIGLIVIAVAAAAVSLWEAFGGGGRVQMVEVPGFHELKLDTPGLYAGVYQHRGNRPLPAQALSELDIRIMSKGDYQEIPVLVNTVGQTFERFGLKGMPVFNFVIDSPGIYTMSAVYKGENKGPTVPVFVIPQAVQNIKQTLIVGVACFILFLSTGIYLLLKLKQWAPRPVKSV